MAGRCEHRHGCQHVGAQQLVQATREYEAGLAQALPDDEERGRAMEVHVAV